MLQSLVDNSFAQGCFLLEYKTKKKNGLIFHHKNICIVNKIVKQICTRVVETSVLGSVLVNSFICCFGD